MRSDKSAYVLRFAVRLVRASLRHANATGANSAIQRVPPTGGGRDNANSLAVSGGAQMLARNASSMSAGTAMGGGSRKRETIYLN
ncbi:hypothetical protein niasHS_013772 [Heterodera schachtii]|uniref:Uncharacterized protein n=1 Tax=Heterodera schachtii TaxID=97005 RepID=A0ABD2IS32_HETSC